MDANSIATVIGAIGLAAGSFYGGRKTLKVNDSQLAVNTVDMLTTQLNLLQAENATLRESLVIMGDRVKVLESLITQRAEVEMVRNIVTRIEEKLNG